MTFVNFLILCQKFFLLEISKEEKNQEFSERFCCFSFTVQKSSFANFNGLQRKIVPPAIVVPEKWTAFSTKFFTTT